MPDSQMDVLVDLAPGMTVYKSGGHWYWKGKQNTTLGDVLRELSYQSRRLDLRAELIKEALEGLKPQQG